MSEAGFQDQLERIRQKLDQVRALGADGLKVFGAETHRYALNPPLADAEVAGFEARHGIELPAAYRAFVTEIADGGAGPYYGIYKLGDGLREQAPIADDFLSAPAWIHPQIDPDAWEAACAEAEAGPDTDEALVAWERRYYGGTLILGTQGCAIYHALILNGPHAGRIAYFDQEENRPFVCYEANFLDWYERWLDEILDGTLRADGPSWFGHAMGGDDAALMAAYAKAPDDATRREALFGLSQKPAVSAETLEALEEIARTTTGEVQELARKGLAKFDFARARPLLFEMIAAGGLSLRQACQFIHWFGTDEAARFVDALTPHQADIAESETLNWYLYVLEDAGIDLADRLAPLVEHPEMRFRRRVQSTLAKAPDAEAVVPLILRGLSDADPKVVHAALQASSGGDRDAFRPAYRAVAARFVEDAHHIHANLDALARRMGLAGREAFLEPEATATASLLDRVRNWFGG